MDTTGVQDFVDIADRAVDRATELVQTVSITPDTFSLVSFFQSSVVRLAGSFLIFVAVVGLVYLAIRIHELHQEEKRRFYHYFLREAPPAPYNERWQQVLQLFSGQNPSDWRVAIIEADAMLEDLVTRLGYQGESLGEKMKQIQRADFPMIQQAWEAHKIRNRIAHEGMNYTLSREEANQAFHMYELVFRDARYI